MATTRHRGGIGGGRALRKAIGVGAGGAFLVVALAGIHEPIAGPARMMPPVSALAPSRVFNALSALVQTAAIVEGTVSEVESEYSPETGPWTRYAFSDVVVHRGTLPTRTLEFVQRGGEYPDGSFLSISHTATFVRTKRYIVFLRNTSWNISPVVSDYAFMLQSSEGGQLLVGQNGAAVVAFDGGGPVFSERLYDPADLAGASPKRNGVRLTPNEALSIPGLLRSIDERMALGRLGIGGTFYSEPAARTNGITQAPVPGLRVAAGNTLKAQPVGSILQHENLIDPTGPGQ